MNGLDLVAEVTPPRTVMLAPTAGSGPTIALIDTGVKDSIVANLRARGATLRIHPASTSGQEILAGAPTR